MAQVTIHFDTTQVIGDLNAEFEAREAGYTSAEARARVIAHSISPRQQRRAERKAAQIKRRVAREMQAALAAEQAAIDADLLQAAREFGIDLD